MVDMYEELDLRALEIGDAARGALETPRGLRSLWLGRCRRVSDEVEGTAASLPLLRGTGVTEARVLLLAAGPAASSRTHVNLLLCAAVLDEDGAVAVSPRLI
jgi:hypothetical protein